MTKNATATAETITLRGVEYVILPKAEYLRLCGKDPSALPGAAVDALEYVQQSIASALHAARKHAALSQGELAERLGKSQTLVQRAEAGKLKVSERYMASVLRACDLPSDWVPPKAKGAKASKRTAAGG